MVKESTISRKEQAALTKKRITETMILLMNKSGYNKITIREICKAANTSIGTFYLYYSSKEDILLELYSSIDQANALTLEMEDRAEAIIARFENHLSALLREMNRDLLRYLFVVSLTNEQNFFVAPERVLYQHVLGDLKALASQDRLTSGAEPETLCRLLHVVAQSYLFQWLTDGDLPEEYITADCVRALRAQLYHFIPQTV